MSSEGIVMVTVATRMLECTYNGKRERVEVNLGRPYEENGYFICNYEIRLAGQTKRYKIAGLDSMQALQLAICMLGTMLQSMPGTADWTWNGEPRTGLPKNSSEPITGLDS